MRAAEGAVDLELDAVLRRLPVLDLYRVNMFRITGVATDASAGVVRRRREEALLAARLGTPLPLAPGELALDPPPDAHALKDAFEAMYNPTQRLLHEVLWFWREDGPHDTAVAAHCAALEGGDSGRWGEALASWAAALDDPGFWAHVERRAKDLDDPRVGPATIARLREVLPVRILAVSAELAVTAAAAGRTAAATAHLDALRTCPFPPDLVADVVRRALAGVESRVHDEAADAARTAADRPEDAADAGAALLDRTGPPLAVFTALLGPDDALTSALHDEVANTVTRCGVAHYNATEDPARALALLKSAAGMARETTTVAFVKRNLHTLADARILAVVAPWRDAGDVDGAAEVLSMWRYRTSDPEVREIIDRLLEDPRAVRADVGEPPGPLRAGCGVHPFGRRAGEEDDTWIETRCVTVFFVPMFPLGAYLSDDSFVYAKVPMSPWTRWAQVAVLAVAALLVAAVVFGPLVALGVAALVTGALVATHLSRRHQMRTWLDEKLPQLESTG